jgi:16S rRNA (cytosine1402-N4)-methyltransferase
MLTECINALNIKPDGIYVDGTLGGGGHAEAILGRLSPAGRLIAIDRDGEAIAFAAKRLERYAKNLTFIRDNYKNLDAILDGEGIKKIDGAILDLGISSHQIDEAVRGFSYMKDAPLDMRMDTRGGISAGDVVNTYRADKLADVIYRYGEERFARRIAERIVERRAAAPIKTTLELAGIIRECIPAKIAALGGHPAKKTFQAIRIEVNGELNGLEEAVRSFADRLDLGGRLVVLDFHSGEAKIIKGIFRELSTGCICSKKSPICVCGHTATHKQVNTHSITATEAELTANPRSAPAKLRAIERIKTSEGA